MTDIVERMRDITPKGRDVSEYHQDDLLILKAADEIERLRSWLINIQIDISGISDVCGRIADQVEKVRLEGSDD